jgi:hypothetical protein
MIDIWTLGVGLVLRIDISRWRVVLGTVRNIYVLVGALGCAAAGTILTDSEPIAQANLVISFVAAALFIPPFEIMDIPAVLGTYLVIPPIVVYCFSYAVKYLSTGIFGYSTVRDVTYDVGVRQLSVLTVMISVFTVVASLVLSKLL